MHASYVKNFTEKQDFQIAALNSLEFKLLTVNKSMNRKLFKLI